MIGRNPTGNRAARRAWAAVLEKHVKPGRVVFLEIRHDDWCGIYTPERLCNCNPDRVLRDDKSRVLAHVKGAGNYDQIEEALLAARAAGGAA